MKAKILVIVALCLSMASCSNPSIQNFTASDNGIEYEYEVIVPLMNFVRIKAVTPADQLVGEVTLPSTVNYNGTRYVVSQIAESAFEGYTGLTEVTLPSTITTIEKKAFRGCTALQEINTPQTLSTIEEYAFENCTALEEFDMEASISAMGEGCFRNCSELEEITLPTSLNTLPAKAFEGCTDLETVYIDRVLLSVGSRAFAGCSNVTSFTCMAGTPPTAYADTFEGMNANITVYVPMASVSQYCGATGWNYFTNFVGVN